MITNVDKVLIALALVYLSIASVYLLTIYAVPTVLIPLIVTLMIYSIKKFRVFTPLALMAVTLSFPILSIEGLYLSIPLSIATPFILRRFEPGEDRQILGSTTISTVRYMLLAIPLVLVNINMIVVIALATSTAIVASIISYALLSKIRTEVIYIPDTVTLGRSATAILKIFAPFQCSIVVSCSGTVNNLLAKGEVITTVDITSNHVGINIVDIVIKAYDLWGFSGRIVGRYTITYRVIPIARRVVEVVEKELKLYRELYDLAPSIEVAVLDLEQGVSALARGREVVRVLSEIILKTRASYISVVLEYLKNLIEELMISGSNTLRKSRYGEYVGVRQYVPGDRLKHIHWKKSVSKGMLVVKEYSSSGPRDVGGTEGRGLEPLVIVDLYAANVIELDRIVVTLLRLCLNIFRNNPELKLSILLILGNTLVMVKGKAVDILYKLYRFFKDSALRVMFNYTPVRYDDIAIEGMVKAEPKPKLLSMYIASNNKYAKNLLDLILLEEVMLPKPFTIIHSDALTFRYSIVKSTLSRYGFIYTSPEAMMDITSMSRVTGYGS